MSDELTRLLEGKLSLPNDEKSHVHLFQPFLLFQLCIPGSSGSVTLEFSVTDLQNQNRRFFISTSIREAKVTSLHASLPFPSVKTGQTWTNLCFDVPHLLSYTFKGASFKSIGSMSINGSFKLRKVMTLKNRPPASETTIDISSVFKPVISLPRPLELPAHIKTFTIVVGMDDILQFKVVATKIDVKEQQRMVSTPPLAFGRSIDSKTLSLQKNTASQSSNTLKMSRSNSSILGQEVKEKGHHQKDSIIGNMLKQVVQKSDNNETSQLVHEILQRASSSSSLSTPIQIKTEVSNNEEIFESNHDMNSSTLDRQNSHESISQKGDSHPEEQIVNQNESVVQDRYSPITQLERDYAQFLSNSQSNDEKMQHDLHIQEKNVNIDSSNEVPSTDTAIEDQDREEREKEALEFWNDRQRRVVLVSSGSGPTLDDDGEEFENEELDEEIVDNTHQDDEFTNTGHSILPPKPKQDKYNTKSVVEKVVEYEPKQNGDLNTLTSIFSTSKLLTSTTTGKRIEKRVLAPAAETNLLASVAVTNTSLAGNDQNTVTFAKRDLVGFDDILLSPWDHSSDVLKNKGVKYVSEADKGEYSSDEEEEEEVGIDQRFAFVLENISNEIASRGSSGASLESMFIFNETGQKQVLGSF